MYVSAVEPAWMYKNYHCVFTCIWLFLVLYGFFTVDVFFFTHDNPDNPGFITNYWQLVTSQRPFRSRTVKLANDSLVNSQAPVAQEFINVIFYTGVHTQIIQYHRA